MTAGRLAATAVAVTALIVGGCGDEDGDAPSGPAAGGSERVVIEARDGAFDPHQIFRAVAPGVVTVRPVFSEGLLSEGDIRASGFVLNDRGEIATNAHVVTDGELGGEGTINEVDEIYVEFADRNQVEAEIIGYDRYADVALIKVDPEGLELAPVELGSSDQVEVGDSVAVIGSPFGAEQSLSVGIVSATDRAIGSLSPFRIGGAIQTDASINPGNSGGPLIDAGGRVIGVNQQIASTTGEDEGLGFAVPIDLAKRAFEQLRSDGEVSYAYVGLTTQALYPQLAERLDLDLEAGALVAEVAENGPADDAGIRGGDSEISFQAIPDIAVGGDVILSVDGEDVVDSADFAELISEHEAGEEVVLGILRDGDRQEITVELGDRSDAPTLSPG